MRRMYFTLVSVMAACAAASAFDIMVSFDARSEIVRLSQYGNCPNYPATIPPFERSRQTVSRIGNEAEIWSWIRDLGVTYAMVYYPYSQDYADFASYASSTGNMKLVNWNWPAETFKYLESGYREILVGDTSDQWVTSDRLGWGHYAKPTRHLGQKVLACGPSVAGSNGSAEDMWLPTAKLGGFQGWMYRDVLLSGHADSANMRWHIRVLCDAARHGGSPNDPLIGITWYVADKVNNEDGFWSYAEQIIRLSDLRSPGSNFEKFEFTLDPATDQTHAFYNYDCDNERLTKTFVHQFEGFKEVCMKIRYYGRHDVYIREVDVYDEGYWRMMVSPESLAVRESIGKAFQDDWNSSHGTLAGWYYDEWPSGDSYHVDTQVRSFVKVNRILQDRGLPTYFLNGNPHSPTNPRPYWTMARDDLYRELDRQGVRMPVQMNEVYFTANGTRAPVECGNSPVHAMKTDSTSDGPYIEITGTPLPCVYRRRDRSIEMDLRYRGHKSLQCALDDFIWGAGPIYRNYPRNSGFTRFINNIPKEALWYDSNWTALDFQIRLDHAHGNKSWGMISTYVDSPDSTGEGGFGAPIRTPRPNEVKLGAWLSVACDADGIIYYPFGPGGATIQWDTPGADHWGGKLCSLRVSAHRTPNYFAAAHVDSEILRIAPTLEPLTYVRTYSSRAYEMNYPGDATTQAWIARDILGQTSSGTSSVAYIRSYAPRSSTAEQNTYVQVSRFNTPGATGEDYWLLIVNRRALAREHRRVELGIENVNAPDPSAVYSVQKLLAGTTETAASDAAIRGRIISVELPPGEAELVHFTGP